MIFKTTPSLRTNTRGSVGTEQILAVVAVGILGIGGLSLTGRSMEHSIAGDARGAGTMAVASQAGTAGDVVTFNCDAQGICSAVRPPPPTRHFGQKHRGDGESFVDGLRRHLVGEPTVTLRDPNDHTNGLDWLLPGQGTGLDDIYRGIATFHHDIADALLPDFIMKPADQVLGLVGNAADKVLPGKGLLPGDILDGVLPGRGFFGDDGYFTRAGNGIHRLGSAIADFLGWNDDVHAQEQLKNYDAKEEYDAANLHIQAAWNRLNDMYGRADRMSADELRAAIISLETLKNGNTAAELKKLAHRLDKQGAGDAADLFRALITSNKQMQEHVTRYLTKFTALLRDKGGKFDATTAVAIRSVEDAKAALAAARTQKTRLSPASLPSLYFPLKGAEASLVSDIENYDAALADELSPADHRALTTKRAALEKQLEAVTTMEKKLLDHATMAATKSVSPLATKNTVDIGTAAVQEEGGAQTTRTGN